MQRYCEEVQMESKKLFGRGIEEGLRGGSRVAVLPPMTGFSVLPAKNYGTKNFKNFNRRSVRENTETNL